MFKFIQRKYPYVPYQISICTLNMSSLGSRIIDDIDEDIWAASVFMIVSLKILTLICISLSTY